MAILTIDYVQEQIAKEVALGNTFLELSEEKWLYGKAHLEKEWKRPLKEYSDQSLYERLQCRTTIVFSMFPTKVVFIPDRVQLLEFGDISMKERPFTYVFCFSY